MPRYLRVYFAALGWANRIGHAQMAEGQLAAILGVEEMKYAGQAVNSAIDSAKRYGLIEPMSGARCLVVPSYHFQKNAKGSASCHVHGIRV